VALTLTDDQAAIVQSFRDFVRNEVTGDRVRAAEPIGFDEALWKATSSVGAVGIGIPTERGGGGESLLESALVVEQFGAELAPVPLVEALVSGRLLSTIGTPEAKGLLSQLIGGKTIVTIALRPTRDGWTRLVPAGAVAGAVIALADEHLVLAQAAPGERREWIPNLGSAPLADWHVASDARQIVVDKDEAVAAMASALDEWRVLTAAALVGLAARALELGVLYAKGRSQFGRPIAGFQSVAHGLADLATAIDGARLLAYEAAWAIDHLPSQAPALASMTLLFASQVAAESTYGSLHYHGGYGFMDEYDIQLYYRRARGWPLVLGPTDRELLALADRLWAREGGS
jgi:alkylation response protein AidB-like acyl-CoA dehydrogenase